MTAIVCLLSVVFVVGVSVALSPAQEFGRSPTSAARRSVPTRALAAVAAGGSVLVMSAWLVPAVVVGIATFWVGGVWQRRQRVNDAEVTRLEALATWIENVRDVLMAGEQPIGAITSTAGSTAPPIRGAVRRLAAGLGRREPELVIRRFADDLDDPLGDLVAAGLAIAVRRGARTVPVLSALAEQTRQQVDRRRLIEAERAPTRREAQALTLIMGSLVMALLVFGRQSYLDAYDAPGGQLFLGVALASYAALIVRVQRLAAFPRPSRFLTAPGPADIPERVRR